MKEISNPSAGIAGFARMVVLSASDPMSLDKGNGIQSFGFRVVGVKSIRQYMDFGMIYKTYWIKLGVVVESLLLFTTMARDNTHHAGSRKLYRAALSLWAFSATFDEDNEEIVNFSQTMI